MSCQGFVLLTCCFHQIEYSHFGNGPLCGSFSDRTQGGNVAELEAGKGFGQQQKSASRGSRVITPITGLIKGGTGVITPYKWSDWAPASS